MNLELGNVYVVKCIKIFIINGYSLCGAFKSCFDVKREFIFFNYYLLIIEMFLNIKYLMLKIFRIKKIY